MPKDVKKKQKNEDPELINPSKLARRSGDTNCEIGSNTSSHCRSGANAVKEYYVGSVAGGKCRVGSGFCGIIKPPLKRPYISSCH